MGTTFVRKEVETLLQFVLLFSHITSNYYVLSISKVGAITTLYMTWSHLQRLMLARAHCSSRTRRGRNDVN